MAHLGDGLPYISAIQCLLQRSYIGIDHPDYAIEGKILARSE